MVGHHGADLGQIQAGRKVIAVPEQHAGAQLLVGAENLIRRAQRLDGRQVEGVALGRRDAPRSVRRGNR
jgi:hypothetical protein